MGRKFPGSSGKGYKVIVPPPVWGGLVKVESGRLGTMSSAKEQGAHVTHNTERKRKCVFMSCIKL